MTNAPNPHLAATIATVERSDVNPVRALPRDLETDAKIARILLEDAEQNGVTTADIAKKVGDHAIDRIGQWAIPLGWVRLAANQAGYEVPDLWVLTQTGRRVASQRIDMWERERAARSKTQKKE